MQGPSWTPGAFKKRRVFNETLGVPLLPHPADRTSVHATIPGCIRTCWHGPIKGHQPCDVARVVKRVTTPLYR